jgi:Holliday junction resolvase RusA-like endonuclease
MKFRFEIYGNPVPQGRPRAFRRGGYIGMYDPKPSKDWKETIRWQALKQNPKIFLGALKMKLTFLLPRPKSLPKKVVHHIKKPDCDNLIKAAKDALKGICYKDDSQIIEIYAIKKYAVPGLEKTGIVGEIEEVE